MGITITLPEEVASVLGSGREEREQRACESIALELYREGKISLRTMGRLAGVGDNYWAADAFRARHRMPLRVDADDIQNEKFSIDFLVEHRSSSSKMSS